MKINFILLIAVAMLFTTCVLADATCKADVLEQGSCLRPYNPVPSEYDPTPEPVPGPDGIPVPKPDSKPDGGKKPEEVDPSPDPSPSDDTVIPGKDDPAEPAPEPIPEPKPEPDNKPIPVDPNPVPAPVDPVPKPDGKITDKNDFELPYYDDLQNYFRLKDNLGENSFAFIFFSPLQGGAEYLTEISSLKTEYSKTKFLLISYKSDPKDLADFFATHSIELPCLTDTEGKVFVQFDVYGVPSTLIIGKNGEVVASGKMDVSELKAKLSGLN